MQEVFIVDGVPGCGKTRFGFCLADELRKQGRQIVARDQALFEEIRERPGRAVWTMIREAEEKNLITKEFKEQAEAILPDGRRAFWETVAVDAISNLVQGSSVVAMINWRPNDRPFYDLAYDLIAAYAKEPVTLIGVHLRSYADPDANLKSIMERDESLDGRDFLTIYGRSQEQFLMECEAWSKHGPGYIAPASYPEYRNYETVVLDRFKPQRLTPEGLVAAYLAEEAQGIVIEPTRRPRPELVGPSLRVVLSALDRL